MNYVKHFSINGIDTMQVACIELQGRPNATTEGAVGALVMDMTSPDRDVYKCVAVNGSLYTWELLSPGMRIISATITGAGEDSKSFPYSALRFPDNYIVKKFDLILDNEGYLYEISNIGATSCEATYTGSHFGERQLSSEAAAYLMQLYKDSQYVAFTGSLYMNPSTTEYEIGSKNQITFSWSFNKVPTSVTFTGTTIGEPKLSDSVTYKEVTKNSAGSLTYRLYATYYDKDYKKTDTVDTSRTISFYNKYYWGTASLPNFAFYNKDAATGDSYTDEEIKALIARQSAFIKGLRAGESKFAKTKALSFIPTRKEGEYIWYAYPTRLGLATMYAGSFKGGFEDPIIVTVENDSKYIENYYVYRSTESGVSDDIIAK